MKACPYCAEDIQDQAILCRHCGSRLDAPPPGAYRPPAPDPGLGLLIPVGLSGWAIAAGYLGLLSFIPFFAPMGLVISLVAVADLRKHPERRGGGVRSSDWS